MRCEDCPNAEWDCVDGHWYIYGCIGECEEDEAEEKRVRYRISKSQIKMLLDGKSLSMGTISFADLVKPKKI